MSNDDTFEKYAKQCGHSGRNTPLPCEFEITCIACGYNVIRRKHHFFKIQRRKINFIGRLKYAAYKKFCICIEAYKIHEENDYDQRYDNLSKLKIKKPKINAYLIEKNKHMTLNPEFE